MTSSKLNVIVVGGSLGGLFAALILKRLGNNVRILERSPTALLQTQGAGIVAGGETQAFFDKHDRTRTPIAVVSPLRHYLDKDGKQIHREEREQRMTSWDLLYNILRANFDGNESGYCAVPGEKEGDGEASYKTGCIVKTIKDTGKDAVDLSYTDLDGTEHTARATLVIAADGPSSTIRSIFAPNVSRKYVGYVAWRGTVPETQISDAARETFVEKFTFFHAQRLQILAYVIPGPRGSLKKGERLVNWVWYHNYPEESAEYADLMTDTEGKRHRYTLPAGKMKPEIWTAQKELGHQVLPSQFAELVQLTREPFIQAVTDVTGETNVFMNGKVVLVGDSVAGFRPHTAASTSQAALDALLLEKVMKDEMGLDEWETETMAYAKRVQRHGVELGERSQFGRHPLAG